ncbi:site-specific DNA-methyltransferase [uncultured Hyphomonas sp.]|uniref:site-specific DNA-methyltransferase n=1 Tax=uncultured Hyphomonas sp. TaxID=225298 RepID=UPI000C466C3A|nr:site-specific DNA-methyltransferase [Hyphomonadaceae bacterium]MBA29099.1 site-specific DNA-methyltransferase [Hyphomonadaceae bacterium]|tara:strand:+ start:4197 stop:5813 length:1617 start_codon:yes stop_codon:yes gene_type:complete
MPTLDWIGKQAVVNHHREVPYRLVHCDSALSAGDPEAGNLLVQGDNLEALRALLPYYAGKVKCVYIDPPYNTGNEAWIYNDNVNSPEIKTWLGNVVGKEAEDLSRHDKWLCMMYPRLRLLREFLRDDGAIFVSIDDNEVHYLRAALDEIFGKSNFITNVVWQKSYTSNQTAKHISDTHDHILIYARSRDLFVMGKLARTEEQKATFDNWDNDPRGPWKAENLSAGKFYSAGQFAIVGPDGREFLPPKNRYWRMNQETYEEWLADGRITFGKAGTGRPMLKKFLSEMKDELTPNTWWNHEEAGSNKVASTQLKEIFPGDDVFSTPKPVSLIQRILTLGTAPDDLILDSFAGSGTTGHAVLEQNKQDGGNRKFILVEMEDAIARDVTAERLRRVIKGYNKGGEAAKSVEGLGGGFRFCRLGMPLFDEFGDVAAEVTFPDLAAHIFFSETGVPIPQKAKGEFLGVFQDRAVYLLFDAAHAETPREAAGNVLTPDRLDALPAPPEPFEGQRVIYAEGCTVSKDRLKSAGAVFKQIPYQIDGV